MKYLIKTQNLSKTFNKGKNNEVEAIKNINLMIEANTCTVLKGTSGSGKTTLLTLLSCLSKPTSGEYICLSEKVSHWSEKFLTQFRRKHIGIVFQHFNLISGFTVFQNISLPLLPLGYSEKKIKMLVQSIAEQINIAHRLHFKVDTLSGGEQQRVAIARALVNEPQILFADEPTAHLDRQNAVLILEIFETLKAKGKTIVIATHDSLVEHHTLVDAILVMQDGISIENQKTK